MARTSAVYLDVETDWSRRLTIVGFRSTETGLVQLVGREISRARLSRELPRCGRLFTYNGHCFDLACIRDQLGLDLRDHFDSFDLRWICQRHGLTGGQKMVEVRAGVRRTLEGYDGRDAMYLWSRYKVGDEEALQTLLLYNAEDIAGLVAIRQHLSRLGVLCREH